jgi:hypothetical protein
MPVCAGPVPAPRLAVADEVSEAAARRMIVASICVIEKIDARRRPDQLIRPIGQNRPGRSEY